MAVGGVLVELCAGMAAVSHRAAWAGTPPVRYQGGKRAYAGSVLSALAVVWPPSRIVLVEADPCVADALWGIWTPEGRSACIGLIESWADPDEASHRQRWDRYLADYRRDGWLDLSQAERAARWLWFMSRAAGHGVGAGWWVPRLHPTQGSMQWSWNRPADRLRRLPGGLRAEVICSDATTVEPIPGAAVYIDPPYVGTRGYTDGLAREQVLALAHRWSASGCRVVVSEAEPLPTADRVQRARYRGARGRNNYSRQKIEVLSIWAP